MWHVCHSSKDQALTLTGIDIRLSWATMNTVLQCPGTAVTVHTCATPHQLAGLVLVVLLGSTCSTDRMGAPVPSNSYNGQNHWKCHSLI